MSAAADDGLHGAFPPPQAQRRPATELQPHPHPWRQASSPVSVPSFPSSCLWALTSLHIRSGRRRRPGPPRGRRVWWDLTRMLPGSENEGKYEIKIALVLTAERGLGGGRHSKPPVASSSTLIASLHFRNQSHGVAAEIDETAFKRAGCVGWGCLLLRSDDTISAPRAGIPETGTKTSGGLDDERWRVRNCESCGLQSRQQHTTTTPHVV